MTNQYENHIPPEGINTSKESPFQELIILIGGIALFIAVIIACLHFLILSIAPHIPYEYESSIADYVVDHITDDNPSTSDTAKQTYLQTLADELSAHMEHPSDMPIKVHYSNKDTVNAFATLGGHVFMYKGLIDKLPNENALSMVLAHEIAHVAHRHPIISMGQGLTLAIAVSAISMVSSDEIASSVMGFVNLNSMHFSREQEHQSDESGLQAVAKKYGHTQGADALFKVFMEVEEERGDSGYEFLSTHPLSNKRLNNIASWSNEHNWPTVGQITTLPSVITAP
ncbi:MAG: M48 family metallopeptidase [Pseudomonadota bacterium]